MVPTSLDFPRFLPFSKKNLISLDKIEKIMNFPRFYFFLCAGRMFMIYTIYNITFTFLIKYIKRF